MSYIIGVNAWMVIVIGTTTIRKTAVGRTESGTTVDKMTVDGTTDAITSAGTTGGVVTTPRKKRMKMSIITAITDLLQRHHYATERTTARVFKHIRATFADAFSLRASSPSPSKSVMAPLTPRLWLQIHETAIKSVGGDKYVMANYLPLCLENRPRTWLTSLPDNSIGRV